MLRNRIIITWAGPAKKREAVTSSKHSVSSLPQLLNALFHQQSAFENRGTSSALVNWTIYKHLRNMIVVGFPISIGNKYSGKKCLILQIKSFIVAEIYYWALICLF